VEYTPQFGEFTEPSEMTQWKEENLMVFIYL